MAVVSRFMYRGSKMSDLMFCGTVIGTFSECEIDDDNNYIYFDFVPGKNICNEEIVGVMSIDHYSGVIEIYGEDGEVAKRIQLKVTV